MKSSQLAVCGLFLLGTGVGIGWLAASSKYGNLAQAADPHHLPRVPSRSHPANLDDSRLARLRALADDPTRLGHPSDAKAVSPKDLPILIDLLASRGGISGLEGMEIIKIKRLVTRWYEESPDDTLAWIMTTMNAGNRRFYFGCVLQSAAKKDPMEALKLAETYRTGTGDPVSLSEEFFIRVAQHGADPYVRALALTVDKTDNATGWWMEYPSNFDFKAAADGISGLCQQMREGERSASFPCNFLGAWAKQDARAAFEWANSADAATTNKREKLGARLSDFFAGYSEVVEPAEFGRFVAEATLSGGPNQQSWGNAIAALGPDTNPTAVEAFLAEASSHLDKEEIITKLLDASRDLGGYGNIRTRLFAHLSQEQRSSFLLDRPEEVRRKLGAGLPK